MNANDFWGVVIHQAAVGASVVVFAFRCAYIATLSSNRQVT